MSVEFSKGALIVDDFKLHSTKDIKAKHLVRYLPLALEAAVRDP